MVQDVGAACPKGLSYMDVTHASGIAAERIDVRVVAATDHRCERPLAEVSGVALSATHAHTIAFGPGEDGTPVVRVLPEAEPLTAPQVRVRYVHMLAKAGALVFGVNGAELLPTEMLAPISGPVPPGAVAPAIDRGALGPIDAHGYTRSTVTTGLFLGAAQAGATDALLSTALPRSAGSYTLFAIGDTKDVGHPARALLCDEADLSADGIASTRAPGLLAACAASLPPSLAIESFSAGLYGNIAPYEAERRPYIVDAIRQRKSDVLCVLEAARPSDQDAIIQAAAAQYPYAVRATADLASPPDDDRDLLGVAQPAPESPPCGADSSALVDAVYGCVSSACVSTSSPGRVGSGTCLSERCAVRFIPLIDAHPRCYACVISTLTSDATIEESRRACSTDARAGYAFSGVAPTLVLSRFPVSNVGTYVLPSTSYRKVVVHADLEIERDQRVRVFCGQFSVINDASIFPYTGRFGAGPNDNAWANEQLLQAKRLVEHVEALSQDGVPAIVTGDFRASLPYESNGELTIGGVGEATMRTLLDAFTSAEAEGYVPTCTACPRSINPLNGAPPGLWSIRTFLRGWAPRSTLQSEVAFRELVVPIGDTRVPLSEGFGYSVRLLRPRKDR
jgi:hypothetical protein